MDMKAGEAFTPGEYLKDELDARRWTQTQFARIIGRPIQVVNQDYQGTQERHARDGGGDCGGAGDVSRVVDEPRDRLSTLKSES